LPSGGEKDFPRNASVSVGNGIIMRKIPGNGGQGPSPAGPLTAPHPKASGAVASPREATRPKATSRFIAWLPSTDLAIREALKHFATNGGSIINISSVVSRLAPPQNALYVATKSAVDGITRSLAKELGPRNIRVNAINPGVVETEGTHAGGIIGSAFEQQAAQQAPLGRSGQPADIAAVAVFLASDWRRRSA
jgi:NAD(P)-dependent dehydrogenase (short-subunit alcohol dehydrogenase family)